MIDLIGVVGGSIFWLVVELCGLFCVFWDFGVLFLDCFVNGFLVWWYLFLKKVFDFIVRFVCKMLFLMWYEFKSFIFLVCKFFFVCLCIVMVLVIILFLILVFFLIINVLFWMEFLILLLNWILFFVYRLLFSLRFGLNIEGVVWFDVFFGGCIFCVDICVLFLFLYFILWFLLNIFVICFYFRMWEECCFEFLVIWFEICNFLVNLWVCVWI